MDHVFDYSEYVEDSESFSPSGERPPRDVPLFANSGWCPFCRAGAKQVADESDERFVSAIDEQGKYRCAWQCRCGWWQARYRDYHYDSGMYWDHRAVRSAILRRYVPSDSDVPIRALRQALLQRPELIDSVRKNKAEELVGSIFRDNFDCEVRLVGRSGDGGIDLILVLSDKEVLVQVKHRDKGSHAWRAEPVSTVREFLGALRLAQGRYGILVTTAQHFTAGAIQAAAKAVTIQDVQQYDLVDGPELFRTLSLVNNKIEEHWRKHLAFEPAS
jgi:restriction system protein